MRSKTHQLHQTGGCMQVCRSEERFYIHYMVLYYPWQFTWVTSWRKPLELSTEHSNLSCTSMSWAVVPPGRTALLFKPNKRMFTSGPRWATCQTRVLPRTRKSPTISCYSQRPSTLPRVQVFYCNKWREDGWGHDDIENRVPGGRRDEGYGGVEAHDPIRASVQRGGCAFSIAPVVTYRCVTSL